MCAVCGLVEVGVLHGWGGGAAVWLGGGVYCMARGGSYCV